VDVATLKEQARGLEQQGKTADALAIYRKILAHLEGSSGIMRELPLYVKAGDLNLKLGDQKTAISMYERAAKRYAAYGSGKSVIALCTKILRVDATRSYEYLTLANRMIERGHVAEASKVLASYADRMKLGKAKRALEQLTDRPDSDVRPVLDLMLEVAGRGERERMKAGDVVGHAGPEEEEAVSAKRQDEVEEPRAVPTQPQLDTPVDRQRKTGEDDLVVVDHATASLGDSGSRPAVDPPSSLVRDTTDELVVDHSSASLDDSGSRPAIDEQGPEHAAGRVTVDHESASLDDSGARPALEHGPPAAAAAPGVPAAEPSPAPSGDVPADTLPWSIERQAQGEPTDEVRTVEPASPPRVSLPPRELRRSSQPRRALTLTTQRRRKGRGTRIGLAAALLIVGGGAVLWFSDLLPFGRGGDGAGGEGTAVPSAADTGSTAAAPSRAAGESVGLPQLEDIDSLARVSLDSIAPPVVNVTFDSLADTTGPAVVPEPGEDTLRNIPQDAQQIGVTDAIDSVVAVSGLAVQRVTMIETGGYVVEQILDSGERLTLTVIPLGSDSADPTATGQVQVEFVGDTAIGRVLFGGYTIRASGSVTVEAMERLLLQLVQLPLSVP
jgi:hypothetical protein